MHSRITQFNIRTANIMPTILQRCLLFTLALHLWPSDAHQSFRWCSFRSFVQDNSDLLGWKCGPSVRLPRHFCKLGISSSSGGAKGLWSAEALCWCPVAVFPTFLALLYFAVTVLLFLIWTAIPDHGVLIHFAARHSPRWLSAATV